MGRPRKPQQPWTAEEDAELRTQVHRWRMPMQDIVEAWRGRRRYVALWARLQELGLVPPLRYVGSERMNVSPYELKVRALARQGLSGLAIAERLGKAPRSILVFCRARSIDLRAG